MSRAQLIAWLMFTLSGVIFLVAGIINGDWFSIAASVPWLIGCVIFMLDR